MQTWCIVLYVIVHISICRWAHGRLVEGGRIYVTRKIIRNSILQAGSCLQNVVEAREWFMGEYNFWLWSFCQVMELQWCFMAKFWLFYGYNIAGQTVNTTFKVSWSYRRAILHHSEWPIIFRVHKWSEDELLCTLRSNNNASAGENVTAVARWVIDHVKHQFLGFDVMKSLLLVSWRNM